MGLYDNKNQLNREAAKVALEFSHATEKDIIKLLNSFVPTFRLMKEKYYSFAYGKIKEQKSKIIELNKSLQATKAKAIKVQISLEAYKEYVFYYSSIEHIIDVFQRKISQEEINQSISGIIKKKDLILDNRYWLRNYNYLDYAKTKLFSYPDPYTSVEKANRFIESYQKKLSGLVDSMISIRKDIDHRLEQIDEYKLQTKNETEEFDEFTKQYQNFEKEIYKDCRYRVEQYVKKSPDSEIKKQILKSLNRSKYKAMSKDPKEYNLVTSKTLFNLVADVANALVKLNEQTNDKGME